MRFTNHFRLITLIIFHVSLSDQNRVYVLVKTEIISFIKFCSMVLDLGGDGHTQQADPKQYGVNQKDDRDKANEL